MATLDQIIDDFSFLDDWEDRYRYVIELGKALPDLADGKKTSENKVMGCASQVWLVTHTSGDPDNPVMTFEGDSDAHIVRGLVAIVLATYSGKTASEIASLDAFEIFSKDHPWVAREVLKPKSVARELVENLFAVEPGGTGLAPGVRLGAGAHRVPLRVTEAPRARAVRAAGPR